MKAAVIDENGGPTVLLYEDVPDPECPAHAVSPSALLGPTRPGILHQSAG